MSGPEARYALLLRTARDVRRDVGAMTAQAEALSARRDRLSRAPEDDVVSRVALGLHHWYTALETALTRICRAVEGELPEGGDWHVALLTNAVQPLEPLRPPLVPEGAFDALDELRRFRHFLRNAYDASFEPSRLVELTDRLLEVDEEVRSHLERDAELLEQLAEAL